MNTSRLQRAFKPLLLTFLAASLQFWALDAQSLWYDEGFSAWLAQRPLGEIVARTAADIHPPLYYLLLHGWIGLFGTSEWSLRLPSAMLAVLCVPLIWQVARRLLRQRAAADTAALLVAFSPLWLWYGREARMYTLVLALLLGAALALLPLLRDEEKGNSRPRWLHTLTFAALAAAAVYTHFYAWFVLVAWALAAGVGWLLRRHRLSAPLVLAFALPLLAYLPWLRVTLQRLEADRSYWEGALSPLEVVREGLASWMVGHALFEATAIPIGWAGAALAAAGLLVLGWRAVRHSSQPWPRLLRSRLPPLPVQHWLLLLLWLVMPIVGLLLVSWDRPKYHARYLIFAAPAFFLLLSGLIGWGWSRRWAGRLVATVLTLGLLGIFLFADWNLYTNAAFAKADWRNLALLLQQQREPGDAILLVSGHAAPVFHYYYPSREGVIYLPDEPTLDASAVLGLETGGVLAEELQAAPGVWLVNWQDEVVDPEGVVPALLQAAGAKREESVRFMEIKLSHWTLPPSAPAMLAGALSPKHTTDARFGDALRLLGWQEMTEPAPADEGLPVVLYWEAQKPLDGDYKVRLSVVDEAGHEYGVLDQRPTAYNFPTFRWQQGDARLATLDIPLQPGTPPGDYWIDLSVYREGDQGNLDVLDAAGAPGGQEVRLGPFPVAPAAMGWLGAGPPNHLPTIDAPMLDGQRLLAADIALPSQLEPGQSVPVTLWWRTNGPLPGAELHLGWEQDSELVEGEARSLASTKWRGEQWRPGDLLMTPVTMRVPRAIEAGSAELVAWLTDASGRSSEHVTLAEGNIVAGDHSFVRPDVALPQVAMFGESVRLIGYDLNSDSVEPGGSLALTLHWETVEEMSESLTTFVHLLDANGVLVPGAGQDKVPLDGERPTFSWVEGEYLSDTFPLALPGDAPPGPYTIEVGWYDASDPAFPRLPAAGEGADGNRVLLQTLIR